MNAQHTNPGNYGVIPPDAALQNKFGTLAPMDVAVIAGAEGAVQQLAGEMEGWLRHDLERLLHARNVFLQDAMCSESSANLHRAAHDLKGLGASYGFPVVSVIADALCKALRKSHDNGTPPQPELVNAHVDALRAVVNLDIRDHSTGQAAQLVRALHSLAEKKTA